MLGFKVTLHSARVFDSKKPGPEFDHLVLQVQVETKWLADVGFGELFLDPIELDEGTVQEQQGNQFKLTRKDDIWTLHKHLPELDWEPQYSFTLIRRRLADFNEMCEYHQTSPDSSFTQKILCTLATTTGRITLSELNFITTSGAVREEEELKDIEQYRQVLRDQFGVDLDGVERLFDDI
jgi:N-hydroxyarylamine O-acetyltransferase